MIKYNDIATREDRTFLSNAIRSLGKRKFESLIPKVKLAFRQAYSNKSNVNKKENAARRAANIIYVKAMGDKI